MSEIRCCVKLELDQYPHKRTEPISVLFTFFEVEIFLLAKCAPMPTYRDFAKLGVGPTIVK